MDNELLKDTVLKLKDRIIKTEAGNIQLSETDTRQGRRTPSWHIFLSETATRLLPPPQYPPPKRPG